MTLLPNDPVARRRARMAALALALGLTALAGAGPALAQDEDDEPTFEQNILRSLLGGGSNASIDYRERSPLVIPPAHELPAPGAAETVHGNAAWPQDPDQKRGTKKVSGPRSAGDSFDRQARPLAPGEIRRGAASGARSQAPIVTLSDGQMGRPLTPAELGEKRSLFGLITSAAGGEKPATFEKEPERSRLTQPPVGYQTPAGGAAYAPPGSNSWLPKIPNFFDRGVPTKDQ
jgi:hypothetical protein